MKALIRDRYGPPDVLEVREVERPVPKEGEVLVRVHAASLNDWEHRTEGGAASPELVGPQFADRANGRADAQRLRISDPALDSDSAAR